MKKSLIGNILVILAILLGVVSGFFDVSFIHDSANLITTIFLRLLKLIGVPIVFLALVSNISGMKNFHEMKTLGKKIFQYAIFTTLIAATIALILFLIIKPVHSNINLDTSVIVEHSGNYFSFLLEAIPDNFIKAFVDNNVIAVAFLGILLGFSILFLPDDNKKTLHHFFASFFQAFLQVTKFIITLMPIGIWGFVCIFVHEMRQHSSHFNNLLLYTSCVVGANLIQGIIVLPLMLKFKKISPKTTIKAMYPALMTAFFTKSSNAALPVSIKYAEEKLNQSPKITRVTHSLCTVINMNACAGFILITVLFVSMSYGVHFSYFQMISWIFLATIAAVGNAGVPMGCYFLTSAFLVSMNVPLYIMGLILPIYTIIDMLESALNVWSNACICTILDKELAPTKIEDIPLKNINDLENSNV